MYTYAYNKKLEIWNDRAREKVNIQVQSKKRTMLQVCTAESQGLPQVLACSTICHQDELNASQQPRDQTASLCLLSSSRPRHLHTNFVASLQLAKSSSQDCFSFCFTFKADQKMWVAARTGSAAAGWGWWFPGRVAWWLQCLQCLQPMCLPGRAWTTFSGHLFCLVDNF